MSKESIIRYSIQLAMAKLLYGKGLITEAEHIEIVKKIQKDYRIVSNLTV